MSGNQAARYRMFGGVKQRFYIAPVQQSYCETLPPHRLPDRATTPILMGNQQHSRCFVLHNAFQQIEDARLCYHTSRSVVGSSAMINGDSHSTAIAIIMRCKHAAAHLERVELPARARRFPEPHRFYGSGKRSVIEGFPSARQVSRAWGAWCSGLRALARVPCMMVVILDPLRRAQGEAAHENGLTSPLREVTVAMTG